MTEEMPVADISDSVIMGSLDRSIHKGDPWGRIHHRR
jgi:hypothetical protein